MLLSQRTHLLHLVLILIVLALILSGGVLVLLVLEHEVVHVGLSQSASVNSISSMHALAGV
jgi:hypothetical protein